MKLLITIMFTLACEITVGNYRFRQVNSIEIKTSWRELGDTAIIKLPNLKDKLDKVFVEGDQVSITLGYLDKYSGQEFVGFVDVIKPNIPFELHCEDHTYYLKRTNLKKAWRAVTLKELIQFIVDETNAAHGTSITLHPDIPVVNFEKFRLNNVTGYTAMTKLKEEYGLTAYFRGEQLYVGLAYKEAIGEVGYRMDWNVIGNDLTYRRADQVKIKLKAIGITKDNKQVPVPVGDEEGEERTLFFYGITNEAKLKELGEEELKKLKYEGFEGSLKTFLIPFAKHGMNARIEDPQYNEGRSGIYRIDSVTTTFNTSDGAKREVELGIRLDNANDQN